MIFVLTTFMSEHVFANKPAPLRPKKKAGPKVNTSPFLDVLTFSGPTVLRNQNVQSLEVNGKLQFHNINVKGKAHIVGPTENSDHGQFGSLEITGSFIASNIKTNQLVVTGNVKLRNLNVSNNTHIIGSFHAKSAHLKDLYVFGNNILLDNVYVLSILIQKMNNVHEQQVLRLKGRTVVSGNITFGSGKGIIEVGPRVIIKGRISRGAIVKKIQER
ncbi:MAG: hypothetical protein JSR85_02450 [Proteobacteria bacterium]|nr:hypothetical protein [Pseudomonadota bacterium]